MRYWTGAAFSYRMGCVFVLLLALGSPCKRVMAQEAGPQDVRQPITDIELQTLPRYCLATRYLFAGDPNQIQRERQRDRDLPEAERKKWEEFFGPGFLHLHHYCWALYKINRANQTTYEQYRDGLLIESLAELDYVTRHVGTDFILLPEVLVRKGLVLQLLGRHPSAVTEFLSAIDILPSYAPAYLGLSDSYVALGQPEGAIRVLKEGLRHTPNSDRLKRRLAAIERVSK